MTNDGTALAFVYSFRGNGGGFLSLACRANVSRGRLFKCISPFVFVLKQ